MTKNPIIYQMFLRAFSAEGTLKAAEERLPEIKELGVDIVYLCPIVKADGDERREFWSTRQKRCGFENPKNPYRMTDFYEIDEEYGSEDDLRSFVKKAHELDLKVLLDLVYMHCGPTADFAKDNEDYLKHDENGNLAYTEYNFLVLNLNSEELREYLWRNMEYFVKEFDVDGYRCDVGCAIPLDFWAEGLNRIKKIKPDVYLLNEGMDPVYVTSGVFDSNYFPYWSDCAREVFVGDKPAYELVKSEVVTELPENSRVLRAIDTHDTVNDSYDNRFEKAAGGKRVEAALVLQFTLDGVPFIYNGNEVCDTERHSICSNRYYGHKHIDWSMENTLKVKKRRELIRALSDLRHSRACLSEGSLSWLENTAEDEILSFKRENDDNSVIAVINTTDKKISVSVKINTHSEFNELLKNECSYNFENGQLLAELSEGGYLLLEKVN